MRTLKEIREAKLSHLELIALGMALAQTGDREKIIESIDPDGVQHQLVANGLRAVESRDPADIRKMKQSFERLGVKVEDSVIDAIIGGINMRNAQRRLEESLRQVSLATTKEEVTNAVERADRAWKSVKELADTHMEEAK